MQLIDTHAHLYAPAFSTDIAQIMTRSQDQYVQKIYMPNIATDTIASMLTLEAQYPSTCAAMMGIHPCYVGRNFLKELETVETWLNKRTFSAIGEIGIDLYQSNTYQAQQEEAFAIQLRWAQQYRLPVVIHCRNSMGLTLNLLEKYQDGHLKGIVHCFQGSLQDAKRIIALGFHLGIGGMVTFKNTILDRIVAVVKLDHLVLETDAPYLTPSPYRGQRNEPAYLIHIAQKIAAIKKVTLATVAQMTTANATHIFTPSK